MNWLKVSRRFGMSYNPNLNGRLFDKRVELDILSVESITKKKIYFDYMYLEMSEDVLTNAYGIKDLDRIPDSIKEQIYEYGVDNDKLELDETIYRQLVDDSTKPGYEGRKARLKLGQTIKFSEKGNSMVPKIYSGQECTYRPVMFESDIKVGDMVWCKVGKHHFTHLVSAKKNMKGFTQYQISNNHGRVNGWIPFDKIFGKVIEIEGKKII